jgi:adenine-specific DNA-methyltransferase
MQSTSGTLSKQRGAYYTPEAVARALVAWAAPVPSDRLIDPACGDGIFIAAHPNSVGIEHFPPAAAAARNRAPGALIHEADFFSWASETQERFEAAAGNPPFIRYQLFSGDQRRKALAWCKAQGANFSGLTSSWAPFVVAASSLLHRGGRIAFVVPAEIGHAPYARPLLDYLIEHFTWVQIISIREKLFPDLSEDCWLLYCEGFGGSSRGIAFTKLQRFEFASTPPTDGEWISIRDWRATFGGRLRPFLLSRTIREFYSDIAADKKTVPLSQLAKVGIGYVSGDNDFFHLRPIITAIQRYQFALANLSGRKWLRDDPSAYEAAALVMVDMAEPSRGIAYDKFPDASSIAHFNAFFRTLYTRYDERFVYNAPDMTNITERREWAADSPALSRFKATWYGYEAREAD